MLFERSDFAQMVTSGLSARDSATQAQAQNFRHEQGVSVKRRICFETEPSRRSVNSWEDFIKYHSDYVRLYVKTSVDQPHTFLDNLEPNSVGMIDDAQMIVRLESLTRPLLAFGYTFDEFVDAYEKGDTSFLQEFCDVWNELRDLRPAFSTLLSEVSEEVQRAEWADELRDRLGLAHYSANSSPEPVILCRYAVAQVQSEAVTGFAVTMPTVLDSDPWEYYFPAPKSLRFGRAMALTLCDSDNDLKVEFLNSRVTYSPEHIWKVGQIVKPAPNIDLLELRERHLLALQIASNDETFGT